MMEARVQTQRREREAAMVQGVDVHTYDDEGNTVLMYAVERGDAELVQLLVGAGVNAANERGMTPLMCAVHCGIAGEHVFRAILAAGVDPRRATTDGDTARTFAEDSDNTLALSLFQKFSS